MDFKEQLNEKFEITKWTKVSETKLEGTVETKYSTNIEKYELTKIEREGLRRTHVIDKTNFKEVFSFGDYSEDIHEVFLTKEEKNTQAVQFCKEFYPTLKHIRKHPYLKNKRLNSKVAVYKDSIVAPIRNFIVPTYLINETHFIKKKYQTDLISLQYITTEDKRFKKNTIPLAHFGFMSTEVNLKNHYDYIYICEGWADMETIRMSVGKDILVVSALSKGHIKQTYNEFRPRYKDTKIILVLDSDDNESRYNYLTESDEKLGTVLISEPQNHIKDINDLHVLSNPLEDKPPVISKKVEYYLTQYDDIFFDIYYFGMDENNMHYLSSTENNTLVIWPSTFGRRHLKMIAPSRYWKKKYPIRKDPDDEELVTGTNYEQAIEDIEVKSRALPTYDPSRIISTGVSYNKKTKKFVCNTGENSVVIGEKAKDKYYIKGIKYPNPKDQKPRSLEPKVIEYFNAIATDKKGSGMIILAHIAMGTIGGGLSWRNVLFLNGIKNSGKTYIMQNIIKVATQTFGRFAFGNSTEAAIRKLSGSNGCPIFLDEYEYGKMGSKDKAEKIGDLIRNSCATEEGYKQYLCNKTGGIDQFETRSTFTLAAIKVAIEDTALLERMIFVTPNAYNTNSNQYKKLTELGNQIDLAESLLGYYSKLFNESEFLIAKYQELYLKYKIWKGKPTGHFGKTMAILNAVIITLTDDKSDKYKIKENLLLAHSSEGINEDGTMAEINTDGRKFLQRLMESPIKYKTATDWEQHSTEYLIKSILHQTNSVYHDNTDVSKALYENVGIYIKDSRVYLLVNHTRAKDISVKEELGANYSKLLKTEFGITAEILNIKVGVIKKTMRTLNITRLI